MTRSSQVELRQLNAEVIRMGGLAEAQVMDAVDAVVRRDVPLAQGGVVVVVAGVVVVVDHDASVE